MRALNTFERAEFLLDNASQGNLNFSVISSYKGALDSSIVRAGMQHLQQMHPLLRATLDTSTKVSDYIVTKTPVPFKEYLYEGTEQWKRVVKTDLAERFNKINAPLWRVSFLKGDNEGQIIITFHHAIADGVCAMQMMNHLYQICAKLLKKEIPDKVEYNTPLPNLKTLYPLSTKEPAKDLAIPARADRGYHTSFVKDVIEELTTGKILKWTKMQGIKVHATLFAALLKAIRTVIKPDFDEFTALTAVNFRPSFNPSFSKDVLVLLRTCISERFRVLEDERMDVLARAIHDSVHTQIESGEHVLNLKTLENRLKRNPSPQELWQRSKFPADAVTVTNLGSLEFSGKYDSDLSIKELFFVANVEPFIEEPTNFILGSVTFNGQIFLTLWFLEELVQWPIAGAVLQEMKKILANLECPVLVKA